MNLKIFDAFFNLVKIKEYIKRGIDWNIFSLSKICLKNIKKKEEQQYKIQ